MDLVAFLHILSPAFPPRYYGAFPQANLSYQDIGALTKRAQDGGLEVVNAKAGKGLATLSIAEFSDIFSWKNFKRMFADDVRIVSSLPSTVVDGPAKENQTPFEARPHSLDPPTLPWTGEGMGLKE
ncbi:malate dehydrogenase 1, mitochondrial-like isoform X1 [Beta vulgaris subsp. vulgaris]|uniref:malate dehydrogenase 1, mitochondrial-like isoform X1 n=1 Tax=Beta vulgaris subsp. vulgaris TaxID=3555 RepID=UPI002036B862|nr:malate dehydrogenase 1, mitochondrial-like isoform X1 [Beta vulgaris subsp. vulgaris]